MLIVKQSAPRESITAAELPGYMRGHATVSSEQLAWDGIFTRKFCNIRGEMSVPGLKDFGIAIQLDCSITLERRLAGGLRTTRIHPGDISIVPKEVPIDWCVDTSADVLHLHVAPALVAQLAEQVIDMDAARIEIVDRLGIRDPLILQIGLSLLAEVQIGGIAGRLYAESLAHTLAMQLIQHHSACARTAPQLVGGLPPRKLSWALEYINAHLAHDIRLADLAAAVSLSPYHFTRLFKQSMGMAPHQYLIERRIAAAQRLLAETPLSIAEIADRVGVSSQSHLTTLFRRRVGVTPAAYRNMR